MLSKKAIKAKIGNIKAKLKPLYKQVDQLCSKLSSKKEDRSTRTSGRQQSKGRGRPPKEGIQKLCELEQKLRNQTDRMDEEIEKIIRTLSNKAKDLTAEIEQKRLLIDRI